MNKPRVKITGIEVSDEYCSDILVTCVETPFGSWFQFRNVERDAELNILSCDVRNVEEDSATVWKHITLEDIRQAVYKTISPATDLLSSVSLADEHKQSILQDDNDAISSDAVLQVAVFGEIIYG